MRFYSDPIWLRWHWPANRPDHAFEAFHKRKFRGPGNCYMIRHMGKAEEYVEHAAECVKIARRAKTSHEKKTAASNREGVD